MTDAINRVRVHLLPCKRLMSRIKNKPRRMLVREIPREFSKVGPGIFFTCQNQPTVRGRLKFDFWFGFDQRESFIFNGRQRRRASGKRKGEALFSGNVAKIKISD